MIDSNFHLFLHARHFSFFSQRPHVAIVNFRSSYCTWSLQVGYFPTPKNEGFKLKPQFCKLSYTKINMVLIIKFHKFKAQKEHHIIYIWNFTCSRILLTDSGVAIALKKSFPTAVFLWRTEFEVLGVFMQNIILHRGTSIYRKKLWKDRMKGFPYQGCLFICSILKEIFNRKIPLQIWGCTTAAWRPTTPVKK